jgi:hypothetical protein
VNVVFFSILLLASDFGHRHKTDRISIEWL